MNFEFVSEHIFDNHYRMALSLKGIDGGLRHNASANFVHPFEGGFTSTTMEKEMSDTNILRGKRILIVDDENDVRETLSDLLDMCHLDLAPDFETARQLLTESTYDVAILDIMGVKGYDLLEKAQKKGIPTLMFTAHALNPDAFVRSMKGGAKAYIPKEKMSDIASYAAEMLEAHNKGIQRPGKWFARLKSFFEKQFGHDWMDKYNEAREKYDWLDFDE